MGDSRQTSLEPRVPAALAIEPDRRRRKAMGAFYTPPAVVDTAVERALAPLLSSRTTSELGRLRIIDPACGSGAFLDGVVRFLRRQAPGLSMGTIRGMIEGVDVEPRAVRVCCEMLRALGLPEAERSLRVADWLLEARQAAYDLVIGNPPWVPRRALAPARHLELAGRLSSAVGQYDLMALFVERAVESLGPDGRIALILPDRWFLNRNDEPLRRFVDGRVALEQVVRLGEGRFAGVTMPAALCVWTAARTVTELRVSEGLDGGERSLDPRVFGVWDEARIPVHLTRAECALAARWLGGEGGRLRDRVRHGRGVEIGRRSNWLQSSAGEDTAPIRFGEDVDRYLLRPGRHLRLGVPTLNYKAASLYAAPKILLRKTGQGVRAALDASDQLVSQVVYILRSDQLDPWYLLGLLNSSSFGFLHRARNGEADKRVFPHLRQSDILALPLPDADTGQQAAVARLAAARMGSSGGAEALGLDRQIDALVERLYGATSSTNS